MERKKISTKSFLLTIGSMVIATISVAQQSPSASQPVNTSRWRTFTNRAGWSIKYPNKWRIASCRSCSDPTDPKVFVTFENPSTKELIMIEHLADKPPDQNAEQWLNSIKTATNLNPPVSEDWILIDGTRSLKVINRNPDSSESENVYTVRGSQTFAIRAKLNTPSYALYEKMLSTLKFTNR